MTRSSVRGILLPAGTLLTFFSTSASALALTTTSASVLSFDDAADWSSSSGSAPVASGNRTEGTSAIQVTPTGYTAYSSVTFSYPEAVTQFQFDVRVPNQQPFYFGQVQAFVTCPSRGVYHQYVGDRWLPDLTIGSYNTVDLPLPQHLSTALSSGCADLSLEIALNVPVPAPPYLLDNLRLAAPPPQPSAEFAFGPDAQWSWHSGMNQQQLATRLDEGYRIVDVEVRTNEPTRYDVVLVRNAAAYAARWWWYPSLGATEIEPLLIQNSARLIQLKPYTDGAGQLRYFVVMVDNTGIQQRNWSWFTAISYDDLVTHLTQTGDRAVEIESLTLGGQQRFAAITDASSVGGPTVLLSHTLASGIEDWLAANPGYRLVDREQRADGGYVAIAALDPAAPFRWRYYNITGEHLNHLAGRHFARAIDIESVVVGTERRYDVLFRDNGFASQGVGDDRLASADEFDRRMQTWMKENAIPGAGLAVAYQGRLIYAKGYGLARIGNEEVDRNGQRLFEAAATATTKFRIGSCSKVFAAAAMLRMIQEGRRLPNGGTVTLDTAIFADILRPGLSPNGPYDPWYDGVTVRHALNHTTGLDQDNTTHPDFGSVGFNPVVESELVARDLGFGPQNRTPRCADTVRWMLRDSTPVRRPQGPAPGTVYQYYNTGPCIISAAVEVLLGGTSFQDYLYNTTFPPLGVSGHIVRTSDFPTADEAQHYSLFGNIFDGSELVRSRVLELGTWNQAQQSQPGSLNCRAFESADGRRCPFDFPGLVKLPYGGVPFIAAIGPGSLAASPVGLARYITALNQTRSPTAIDNVAWTTIGTGTPESGAVFGNGLQYGAFAMVNPVPTSAGFGDVFHNGSVVGGIAWWVARSDGTVWVAMANTSDLPQSFNNGVPSGSALNSLRVIMTDATQAAQSDINASTWDLFPDFGM